MWMRNYLKVPLEQAIVKEHTYKKLKIVQIYRTGFVEIYCNERSIFATQRC